VYCTHTTVLHFFNATIPATLFFSLSVANFWFIVFDERQRHSNLWQQLLQFSFFYSTSTSSKFRNQIRTLRIEQKIDDCAEAHQREFNCQLFLFISLFVVLFFLSLVCLPRTSVSSSLDAQRRIRGCGTLRHFLLLSSPPPSSFFGGVCLFCQTSFRLFPRALISCFFF
jgi:hypothetical protein